MGDEAVRVLVRCRPFNAREKGLSCTNVIKMKTEAGMVSITKPGEDDAPKNFTYDACYDMTSNSQMIYEEMGFPLVEAVLQGFNGTVFAYGQTGCGKSFTMEGIPNPPEHRGITPRSFEHIFQEVAVREDTKFLVRASYLEIYNEQVRDLLSSNVNARLDLREDPDRGVYVKDLSLHEVRDTAGIIKLMAKGTSNRSTGATAMNADSSRSHSVFTCWVEMCTTNPDGSDSIKAGKLNLVDLAGSERQSKTQAEGARLKEATKINLSLSALGNVISALVDGKSKHIPYRDSKLTRLLQDSLGGNTKTLMIAAISPADNNYDETLSTLRYANRAKNIKNKARINEDPKDALLREYQEEIKKLKALLAGDGIDIDALRKQVANEKPTVSRRSLSPVEPDQALIERMQAEKQAEMAEMEKRLKLEYDAKIATLQEKLLDPNVDQEELEREFAEVTRDYEEKKAEASQQAGVLTAIRSEQNPVTVLGPDGSPVISLLGPDGMYIKATIGSDNQLHPVLGEDGKPQRVLGPDGSPAKELGARQESKSPSESDSTLLSQAVSVRYVPTTVIGSNGEPVAALVGPDGRPLKAVVDENGQLVPEVDEDGTFVFVCGPAGQSATKAYTLDEPVSVIGSDGQLDVAVIGASGQPVKAELGSDGVLQAVIDDRGRMKPLLGPDGKRAREVLAVEPIMESESQAPVVIVCHARGSPVVAALCEPDFEPVATEATPNNAGLKVSSRETGERLVVLGADSQPASRLYARHEPIFLADASCSTGITIAMRGMDGLFIKAVSKSAGELEPAKGAQSIHDTVPLVSVSRMGPGGYEELLTPVAIIGKGGDLKPALQTLDDQIVQVKLGAAGQLVPVLSDEGEYVPFKMKSHYRKHAPTCRGTAVVLKDGTVAAGLHMQNLSEAVHCTIDADGYLVPLLADDGKPQIVPGVEVTAATIGAAAVVPKLTAVIGPNGTPVPAILSANGVPVAARVTSSGRIQAVRDSAGNLKPIHGPTGKIASEVIHSSTLEVVATGEDSEPVVAVRDADGNYVAAEVGEGGIVQGAMNESGWPSRIADVRQVSAAPVVGVHDLSNSENDPEVVIVLGDDNQAVPAILAQDGSHLRTQAGPNGKLVPMVDPDTGMPITLDSVTAEATVSILQPITEEEDEPIEPLPGLAQEDALAAQRLEELERKFANQTPVGVADKEKLKEDLRSKKSRSEQKRLARLRKAAANDDDALLEEIYSQAADKLDEEHNKFLKAKELLKASRAETKDLQREFETERQDLTDIMRSQSKQIALLEAILSNIMPVVRRDCNYFNLDRIKTQAAWDEDNQQWLMPKMQINQTELASLSGAPGVAKSRGDSTKDRRPYADDHDDSRLRERLSNSQNSDYFSTPKASDRLLSSLDRRSEQVAAQMESRLARISKSGGKPSGSMRSKQLLDQGRALNKRGNSGMGGSPRLLTRRANGYTANDWLQ